MPDVNQLSEREQEILRLVATGASNKEIARILVISPNTVKVHLRNIFAKVGVASRTEATLFAMKTGLLPSPQMESAARLLDAAPVETIQPVEYVAIEIPTASSNDEDAADLPEPRQRIQFIGLSFLILLALLVAGYLIWPRQPVPTASTTISTQAAVQRWSLQQDLPTPTAALAGVVYNNTIYIVAGEAAGGPSTQLWQYDAATKNWLARAPKPTAVSQVGAALLGEKIYVPGGKLTTGQPTNLLEIYDPRQDHWETGTPLPRALAGYALAVLEGHMYLFGGWDGQKDTGGVYRYDPDLDRWDQRSDLSAPRSFAGAASLDGKILLVGGQQGDHLLNNAEIYFPSRDRPGETPWEDAASLPLPRSAMGLTAIADLVYLVGGQTGDSQPNAPLQYSLQANTWTTFDLPRAPIGRHPLLIAQDTRLHALGGELPGGISAQHQVYQAIYNVVFPVIQ